MDKSNKSNSLFEMEKWHQNVDTITNISGTHEEYEWQSETRGTSAQHINKFQL